VYTLTQSLLHTHTPPPSLLTCSSFILKLTDSVLRTLRPSDTFLCSASSQQMPPPPQQRTHARFKKVNYMPITMLFVLATRVGDRNPVPIWYRFQYNRYYPDRNATHIPVLLSGA